MKNLIGFTLKEIGRFTMEMLKLGVDVYNPGYWTGYKDALTKEILGE